MVSESGEVILLLADELVSESLRSVWLTLRLSISLFSSDLPNKEDVREKWPILGEYRCSFLCRKGREAFEYDATHEGVYAR